jgi:flagellar motor switch protein FliM
MGDVLSQSEIDALLSSISSGDVDIDEVKNKEEEKKIKVYDFKRPDKFSKDQLRTLQMIHETFARLVTTMLSGQLRANCHIQVTSVDQITYEEFIRSIPELTILSVFDMGTLEGNAVLELNSNIGYVIIDRVFGGNGKGELAKARELTDIESTVVEKFVGKMLGFLSEAWQDIIEIMPKIDQMETNPQFVQIAGPTEMVVLLSFEVKVGDASGIMNICYPAPLIDPIISKLTAQYWFSNVKKEKTDENLKALRKRLDKVSIPVVANLGKSVLSLEQFMELNVGDVITLDRNISDPVDIVVGNKRKFKGVPGIEGKKMAIAIEEILDERGE